MDQIIEFADIGEHIDAPLKHYSSGMHVRLGFAVAVMVRPEILIVDEVIAVGDEEFQRKCFDYLYDLRRAGRACSSCLTDWDRSRTCVTRQSGSTTGGFDIRAHHGKWWLRISRL